LVLRAERRLFSINRSWAIAKVSALTSAGTGTAMVSRIQGRTRSTVQSRPKMHSIPKILTATFSQPLIVGCNEDEAATEFLYVDPYPGGSTMKYKGGIAADSNPSKCFFLGLFKVELLRRGPCCARTGIQTGNGAATSISR
jgi:hypothetical protein